jgi:23S rRNA (cytidine1920-2'-O)/16S rRNA (cytidine1409-2'-O)-methyltransferase
MTTYVSRAGAKLEHALKEFDLKVEGLVCADLGASTGGFTDCLLQHGAAKVYSVEKGYGTVDWKLRNDPRVVVMERQSALFVELPELVDFIVIDIGWTKQQLILPKALSLLKEHGIIVSLLKPHYEAEKPELYKGKVKPELVTAVRDRVINELKEMNIEVEQMIESPIMGEKGGNVEYLLLINKSETSVSV